ncbi:MAG: hypothetical protein V5A68_06740 [Candidatus Thermoplasmatota archaeon]
MEKESIAPELTWLAVNSYPENTRLSSHEMVEDFFLVKDSCTMCTEPPVLIKPGETNLDINQPLTGHIDIVQIRYKHLYILDFKPNLRRPEKYVSQLVLYKKTIQKRTSKPEDLIKTAVFNQHNYYEYK